MCSGYDLDEGITSVFVLFLNLIKKNIDFRRVEPIDCAVVAAGHRLDSSFVFAHNIHGSSNYFGFDSTHCDMSIGVTRADLIGDSHVGAVSRVASLKLH
jgi:hypothetical protein